MPLFQRQDRRQFVEDRTLRLPPLVYYDSIENMRSPFDPLGPRC